MIKTSAKTCYTFLYADLSGWCPHCLVNMVGLHTHCIQHHMVKRRWVKRSKKIQIEMICYTCKDKK